MLAIVKKHQLTQSSSTSADQASALRNQYDDLTSQFRGFASGTTTLSSSITSPNSSALEPDFRAAKDRPRDPAPSPSSFRKAPKNVRFRDHSPPPDAQETANRAALFPYRDSPDDDDDDRAGRLDQQSDLNNEQLHVYHQSVLAEQDDQLDRLGESIGRQRDLSIQIGDELDEQVEMLGEVDGHMDRTQGRLDGARARLGKVGRKAMDNKLVTVVIVLIVVLLLLIIIFKRG